MSSSLLVGAAPAALVRATTALLAADAAGGRRRSGGGGLCAAAVQALPAALEDALGESGGGSDAVVVDATSGAPRASWTDEVDADARRGAAALVDLDLGRLLQLEAVPLVA
jgi:hypothetical protein